MTNPSSIAAEHRPDIGAGVAAGLLADVDVFELAVLGMVITDMTGHLRRVNAAFADLVGRTRAELVGASFSSLTSPDDNAVSSAAMRALTSKAVETASFDKRYLRPDGSFVWAELNIRALTDADGQVIGFLTQVVDITERLRAEAAVEAERQRLEVAEHIAGMSNFVFDPETGVVDASDEAARNLGLAPTFEVADFLQRVHADDRATFVASLTACVRDHTPMDHVQRHLRLDGTVRFVQLRAVSMVGEDGRRRVVGTTLDITDLKNAEDALQFRTFHDPLTGLANRALFLDKLDFVLNQPECRIDQVAVLFLDLDDFKTVNDGLGHHAGDALLVAVARRLATVTRIDDTLARLGGDEFALLLGSGIMPRTAEDIAGRIVESLKLPFALGDREVTVRVSIGIAVGAQPGDSSEDLLRDADLAMYLAKQNGKGRFEMAHPGMQGEAQDHLATITDLRRALDRGELEVFYQPIVKVHGTSPAGAEALVRWRHPRRGLVLPGEFIGVAESTGLIVPLGNWVLNEACRQTQAWREEGTVPGDFYISVNLSPRQLAEPALVDDVASALRDSGLPPDALVLEITESSLMLNFDAGLARLRSLKGLGVRLALDDYGTGYSSLNRLGMLPVDIVKIDKSFIDQLTVSREGRALVQSVIDVTNALGMRSVAEGVEQPEQHSMLLQLECGYIQGFLFAKPASATEAAETLLRLASPTVSCV